MSKEETLDKLLEFSDELNIGWLVLDPFRTMLWYIVKGLAWIVDKLENAVDTILNLKLFYNHKEIVEFIHDFQPVLVILLALNILFIGYLLIFQKKFNREGIITNLLVALAVIVLLGSGMAKADHFTNDAIGAINQNKATDKAANKIVKDNVTDVGLYDLNGWKSTKLEEKNNIKANDIRKIDINTPLTKKSKITKDKKVSKEGKKILAKKAVMLGDGNYALEDLEDGGWITDITEEYYYRYNVDWFNAIVTLAIMAFVLITISIKLAKLFFELTFNYLLAIIIAPADVHSGQKTKQILQNIISIFVVTILIFLSMKVYVIGTGWIGDSFTGVPYLIAMLGFALAVIDGPNIVERLFGIDAGLKSGWGAIAGTYAMAKGGAGLAKGGYNAAKGMAGKGKQALKKMPKTSGMSAAAGVGGMKATQSALNGNGNEKTEGKNQSATDKQQQNKKQGQNQSQQQKSQKANGSGGVAGKGTQEGAEVSGSNEDVVNGNANTQNPSIDQEMKAKQQDHKGQPKQSLQQQMQDKKGKGNASASGAAQAAATTANAAAAASNKVGGGAGGASNLKGFSDAADMTQPSQMATHENVSQAAQQQRTQHSPSAGNQQTGSAGATSNAGTFNQAGNKPKPSYQGNAGNMRSNGQNQNIRSNQVVNDGNSGGSITEDRHIQHRDSGSGTEHRVNTHHESVGGAGNTGRHVQNNGGGAGTNRTNASPSRSSGNVPTGGSSSSGKHQTIRSNQVVNDGNSGGSITEDRHIQHRDSGSGTEHKINNHHEHKDSGMMKDRKVGDFSSILDKHREERGYTIDKSKRIKKGRKKDF